MEKLRFQVEAQRVLEILSKQIYDSPYAMLRENVQNAYDATLMRLVDDPAFASSDASITISITKDSIIVTDNGVGMSEEVLRNNFWRAGSSGKNTDSARKAGVVGTFGIGAMANFGVCRSLRVETSSLATKEKLVTFAQRDQLSLSEECVTLKREGNADPGAFGTIVTAELDPAHRLTADEARRYLHQYVMYLPIRVTLNGQIISQQDYRKTLFNESSLKSMFGPHPVKSGGMSASVRVGFDDNGRAAVEAKEITIAGQVVQGEMVLLQGRGTIFGMRNYFGLAPSPVSTFFELGGVANLSCLQPTAGREALTRESLAQVGELVALIEKQIALGIADSDYADHSQALLRYVVHHGRYDLARRVTIEVSGREDRVTMDQLASYSGKAQYFMGRDTTIISSFDQHGSTLFLVSTDYPRRQVQLHYLQSAKIAQVPNQLTVLKEWSPNELTLAEASLVIKIASILADEYALWDSRVVLASLSHNAHSIVQHEAGIVKVLLERNSPVLMPLLECYRNTPDVFTGFVRDYVRVRLYNQVSQYVPSATREGAEALQRQLRRNRELYRYEFEDFGAIDAVVSDYIAGKATIEEVFRASTTAHRSSVLRVDSTAVGRVEDEISDIVESPTSSPQDATAEVFQPAPPILRRESETPSKVLTVHTEVPQLNNFRLFLSLSDKVFNREQEFFLSPHATRVIWGGHRVIYIFSQESGALTGYYDIELRDPLEMQAAGKTLATTTIISKNRIFIPVPPELVCAFEIQAGAKEFYVRFDYVPG